MDFRHTVFRSNNYLSIPDVWLVLALESIPGGKRLQQSVQMLFYSRSMEIMLLTGVHLQEALALAEEMFPKLLRKRIAPVR
jgi:type II secretory pathway component PulF